MSCADRYGIGGRFEWREASALCTEFVPFAGGNTLVELARNIFIRDMHNCENVSALMQYLAVGSYFWSSDGLLFIDGEGPPEIGGDDFAYYDELSGLVDALYDKVGWPEHRLKQWVCAEICRRLSGDEFR